MSDVFDDLESVEDREEGARTVNRSRAPILPGEDRTADAPYCPTCKGDARGWYCADPWHKAHPASPPSSPPEDEGRMDWRCTAQRSHGPCNVRNQQEDESCVACGADRFGVRASNTVNLSDYATGATMNCSNGHSVTAMPSELGRMVWCPVCAYQANGLAQGVALIERDATISRLRHSLETYGQHTPSCAKWTHFWDTPRPDCSCGFDSLLSDIRKTRND